MVANQSYLPIQLAIHNQAYLYLYDLQWRLQELGCEPIAYATDSITFVSAENGMGVMRVPRYVDGADALSSWLEHLRPLPEGVSLHMETEEKTRGCDADDSLKAYICNKEKGGLLNPARSFSADLSTDLFDSRETHEAFLGRVAPNSAHVSREALCASARLVCEPREWTVHLVGDEPVDTTVDRLRVILKHQRSLYIEGQGGSGKTYLVANFLRRVLEDKPDTKLLVTGLTHDGCGALLDAIVGQIPGFDTSQVVTLDAALRSSSEGFSKVNLECEIMVVDEISMLSETHASYLAVLLERQPELRVIWLGDLLQLL